MTAGCLIHLFSWGVAVADDSRAAASEDVAGSAKRGGGEGEGGLPGDIFIFHYCSAVKGGPHRGHRLRP